ncbi:MAG: mechanosensitive ion channel family protein [Verrucomicrobia bacterium]|nr:MAG: mechanosensitive ion channel family protein [Verrucomicrobiota bacterium]
MNEVIVWIESWLTNDTIRNLLSACLIIGIGLPLAALLARILYRVTSVRFSLQSGLMLSRAVRWILYLVIVATALRNFGIDLGAVMGAAGIVGIAVGFAAQTSLSNVISGFFLLAEKPFVIGDFIEVAGTSGVVDHIGMISATIRTADNRSVRIANETLVKSQVINITKHPIRRYDMTISVSQQNDLARVFEILRKTAECHPLCLDEPEPFLLFVGFTQTSADVMLGVWVVKEDYVQVRNSLPSMVLDAFKRADIHFPHDPAQSAMARK